MTAVSQLQRAVERLTERVEKLEEDSHPPVDLTPLVKEVVYSTMLNEG